MASIDKCATEVFDIVTEGILGILLWKNGRSWNVETLYCDADYESNVITPEDKQEREKILEILRQDEKAILVNGYYHNLAVDEEQGTIKDLANALRWQYEISHSRLKNYHIEY